MAGRPSILHFALCILPFAFALCLSSLHPNRAFAQTPYAAINRDAVRYNGPGREVTRDLSGTEIRIGVLLPLTGPRQTEGEALRRAAQMAMDEENAAAPPGGHRLLLVVRDESGPWGQASSQVVHMVFDDQAVAIVTSPEGGTAHLAEQVGNKVGVPVLTLASDSTTTEVNLPWIFRLGPTDAAQAQTFAHDIYQNRKLEHVVLLAQDDHDGRLGAEEFLRAARAMSSIAPTQMVVGGEKQTNGVLGKELNTAQAVVIWSDAATAQTIAKQVHSLRPDVPFYLCRKAVDGESGDHSSMPCPICNKSPANQWTTASQANRRARKEFEQRYRQRFGTNPSAGAAEVYDAVCIVAASLRQSGPNRARLRDALAEVTAFSGASGVISFDHAGNDLSPTVLVRVN